MVINLLWKDPYFQYFFFKLLRYKFFLFIICIEIFITIIIIKQREEVMVLSKYTSHLGVGRMMKTKMKL